MRWASAQAVAAIHDRQLAERGGLTGVRDLGAVESALGDPKIWPLPRWGIARNHGLPTATNGCLGRSSAISPTTATLYITSQPMRSGRSRLSRGAGEGGSATRDAPERVTGSATRLTAREAFGTKVADLGSQDAAAQLDWRPTPPSAALAALTGETA